MTLTLELPADLGVMLAAEAARRGLALADYAVKVLTEGRAAEVMPRTGAELVEYLTREGVIGSRPDILDSQQFARELRKQAERRVPG